MPFNIAVAGKGGVGKTALASLIIYHLIKAGKTPILAVDADPNSNLDVNLGMRVGEVVADLREEVLEKKVPEGMAKTEFMELKMRECLAEGSGVDLLTMGRPEGPGCYCAINNLLRQYLSKIAASYQYVVMDTEAGMEHLSRRTTDNIDVLFIVTDPTKVSFKSAERIKETAEKIKLKIRQAFVVLNKVLKPANKLRGFKTPIIVGEIGNRDVQSRVSNLDLIGSIPFDQAISQAGEEARDLFSLPEDSPSVRAVFDIMRRTKII